MSAAPGVGVIDLSLSFGIENPTVTVFPDDAGTTLTEAPPEDDEGPVAPLLVVAFTGPVSAFAENIFQDEAAPHNL